MRLTSFAIAGALTLLCFATTTALAQRATQRVRFSVTGSVEASISPGGRDNGSASGGGNSFSPGNQQDGLFSAISGQSAVTTSSTPSAASKLAKGRIVAAVSYDSTVKHTGAALISVPIWQAQFTVTNSEPNKKVTVSLDSPMPQGVDLTLELGASKSAVTAGMIVLGTAGTDALTSMPAGNAAVIPLGFGIAAAPGTSAGSRRVNFTLITGA